MCKRLLKFIIALVYKIKYFRKCKINASTNIILRDSHFEGENALGSRTYFSHSTMGYGSYIGYSGEFSNCTIGRYCSIGNNVRVVSATHPINDFVSTHPAFYSNKFYLSYTKNTIYNEHLKTEDGYECKIGNDVWIGDNVLVKGGIEIGDGAIIAMGSLVLHDIPPYTIVAGVPAKEIRKRFDDSVVNELKKIKWWEKSFEWIEKNADKFNDPYSFIMQFREKEPIDNE